VVTEKATEVEQEVVRAEVQEYLYLRQQRRRLFPLAALVGFCAGLVAVLFRGALAAADVLRNLMLTKAHDLPALGWIFPILYCAAGATLALFLVQRFAPETKGSGIPHLEAVLQRLRDLVWYRVLPIKFIGGVVAIGSGLCWGVKVPQSRWEAPLEMQFRGD